MTTKIFIVAGVLSAAGLAACVQVPTRLMTGPGGAYYLQTNNTNNYLCRLEGENLNCSRRVSATVDETYHNAPGYFKGGAEE